MKIVSLCLYLIVSIVFSNGYSQPIANNEWRPVQKDEKVPDFPLSFTDRNGKSITRFSDLRGKWVLFDFWGLNCAPCIKAFPKLKLLQEKFTNEIEIILVNKSSRPFIDSVALRRSLHSSFYRLPDLPQVTSDSILSYLFPHIAIPHYVWIRPDGSLLSHTGDEEVTAENISALIRQEALSLYEKKELLQFDGTRPMLPQLLEGQKNPLYFYSSVLRWVEGLNGAVALVTDSVQGTVRLTRQPYDLLTLVTDAITQHKEFENPYSSARFDYGKRVVLMVKDSSRYFYDPLRYHRKEDWMRVHHFGYEGVFPITAREEVYAIMLADLCRFFQLDVRIEKRKLKAMAIVRIKDSDKLTYLKGRDRSNGIVYTDTSGIFHLYGTGMRIFRDRLSAANVSSDFIFVDQTNYNKPVDLEIVSSLSDIAALRAELQSKYGLDLIETVAEVDVLFIQEQ